MGKPQLTYFTHIACMSVLEKVSSNGFITFILVSFLSMMMIQNKLDSSVSNEHGLTITGCANSNS